MNSPKTTIYLIGDAILDNFYWLTNKETDLKKQLTDLGFVVHNYAVDETKVHHLIDGIAPASKYQKERKYPYPIEQDGKMYPLKLMAKGINVNKSFSSAYGGIVSPINSAPKVSNNMIVISMGGNDLYSKTKSIILGPEYFVDAIINKEFVAHYRRILEIARGSCDKIVLISLYLPFLGNGASHGIYSPVAKPVLKKWNQFVNDIAKEYKIPLLDLGRTLNIGERSHFGTDDTKASNISSACIASCLAHIQSHYNGYHVYYAPDCDASKIITE
jgi:hypothetical protein